MPSSPGDRPSRGWDLGGAFWRGGTRITPLATVYAVVLALSAVLLGSSQPILRGIGLRLGFLAMAMLLVALSIVMFDRPHALVAPHLRHQPGAVAEWLGATVRPSEPPHHQPLRARSR